MQRARNSCCVKDHCGALRPPLAKDVSRHPPVVPTSAVRCTSRAPVHCGHSFPTPQTTLTSGTITKRQLRTPFPPHPALRPPAIPPFPAPNTLCLPPLSADMQCFRQCGCVGACSSASTTVARQPPLWPRMHSLRTTPSSWQTRAAAPVAPSLRVRRMWATVASSQS